MYKTDNGEKTPSTHLASSLYNLAQLSSALEPPKQMDGAVPTQPIFSQRLTRKYIFPGKHETEIFLCWRAAISCLCPRPPLRTTDLMTTSFAS